MQTGLFHLLNMRQMPTGRRVFVMRKIRAAAESLGATEIVDRCDEALAWDAQTMDMELAYLSDKGQESRARGEAQRFDQQIDARLAAMAAIAQASTVGEAGDPVVEAAHRFMAEVFPLGVAALTQLSFEEQLAAVDRLLGRFVAPGDLAAAVDQLGLRRYVTHLGPLVARFRQELEAESVARVTFDKLESARARGRDLLAGVVFLAAATYYRRTPDDTAARNALLHELYRQDALLGEAFRRGRKVVDIDPETGLVQPVGDAPPIAEPELEGAPI
ncbi:hypothetical protein [Bradymonas sediminis]|uniref:hypothetical protein n=1 Tax=Bradymonas sediminis TaxID=1548548 RepID=UPI0010EC397B|nr:hypothetical protein [Bradymonas sediminis]TDP77660.1 hypothetical protein DFR33_101565 [Bradymonas sediminis]